MSEVDNAVVPHALQPLRERVTAAKLLMRYDYAWKAGEFKNCAHRLTGVACRLLYLFALWSQAAVDAGETTRTRDPAEFCVLIDANGYPEFQQQVESACELMGFTLSSSEGTSAQLVFVFIAPLGDERTPDQYATFHRLVDHHAKAETDTAQRPMFCFLMGEAGFLPLPQDDECERLRGLSGFAISQQLAPMVEQATYSSIAHFSVEFTPATPLESSERAEHEGLLGNLMDQFGGSTHNLMVHTEKWEMYAIDASVMVRNADVTTPSEEETRYWLELARGKACEQCYELREKLFRCSRCGNACYCSRECQKAAWKQHKRMCGKPTEEITS